MNEALKQYEVGATDFWQNAYGDGYNVMAWAEQADWNAVARWGKDGGYDLGSCPYVMIFVKTEDGQFYVVYYEEGDVTMYACPSLEVRIQIIDEIAFHHWKHNARPWVEGIETVEGLPEELRGPERD